MAGRDRYLPSSAVSTSSSSRLIESQLIESDRNRARSVILEDRISIQHREIQTLLNDNQRLAVARIGLKDQLNLAKRELERLLETAAKVKAEGEAKVREVYQNALRMEAETRVIDGLGSELGQVRSDVQRLGTDRQELATELAMLDGEMVKAKPNSDRAVEVKAEIEVLRGEISKGRAALELEKKTRASNLHHERGMEKTIDHLNREIVKLQEELVDFETKARAAAEEAPNPSPGLAASYGNTDDSYGGQGRQYPEANGSHKVYGVLDSLPQHPPTPLQHPPNNVL
ncbi:PREDICTED: protein FLC EXPRESSOR-like [Camelina sativa]|uniref:Protein FLC EXPRESSOR-like n=1 Tax=Camelina sativa TaxID=90675 RepID=A0ABM0SPP3_CAMSA|nr:PREDICTED: protein FLC EXPRESSOR-like [Camelina sativa]